MKTVCIYHSVDLDGWMSAAIVKYWWENSPNSIDNNDDKIDFIGYNYGEPIPDLLEYHKVIMCDISFPAEKMEKIAKSGIGIKNFIWIDHHISAIKDVSETYYGKTINGLRDTKFAACELTWKFFFPNDKMPEIVRLLGRYDCFGHKGTEEEQLVLEFQYGAREVIANYKEAYRELCDNIYCENTELAILNKGKSIYSYLCIEAKQIYKNGFEIEFKITACRTGLYDLTKPIASQRDTIKDCSEYYKFICINRERFNPINFGIDYHKDGYDGCACFYFDGKQFNYSLYNDNGVVDVSEIAKQFGGGGHKGAAGFRCNNETFLIILNN